MGFDGVWVVCHISSLAARRQAVRHHPAFHFRKHPRRTTKWSRRLPVVGLALAALVAGVLTSIPVRAAQIQAIPFPLEVQSLDGSGNNLANPSQGRIGQPYSRVAPAGYTDGRTGMAPGPNARFI